MTNKKIYKIDAEGKQLGRIATEAAMVLMGKNTPAYKANLVADVEVVIEHASKLNLTEKKRLQKKYPSYSGYPGGLTFATLDRVATKKGYGEVIRKAVYGMVPNNKLRAPRMKRLIISE